VTIGPARAAEHAAVTGAGILAIEHFLDPKNINDQFKDTPRNTRDPRDNQTN
jgi:hypothetical protein